MTTNRIFTASALAAILLGLVGIHMLMRAEFSDARELRETAEQTVETRSLLGQLLAVHLDVETSVRGYVITGDDAFLEPYVTAIPRRDGLFAALRERADPNVVARLPELERLSDRKLANSSRNADDARMGRRALASQRIADGEGRQLMDEIRTEIAELDTLEAQRLEALGSASLGTRSGIEQGMTLLLAGIAILLALVTLIVSRSVRERHAALARAEHMAGRQSAMFDGAVDGMLLLDERGDILRINPSIERMFGYATQELVGRHNMFLMADEFTPAQSQAWLESVGKAGVDGAGRKQEFTGLRADGQTFETEIAISRLEEETGTRYVVAIRDISHRKRAERMKSEFVSTVSHELRTPLTSIGGSLGLLAGGAVGKLNDKAERLVAIAHNNCERLIRLINDILDIEKIESGKMTFDMRKLTLGPLIERTVNANRQFADDHSVEIEVDLPPWPQCVVGDPDRLEQVLTNLVSNAIKHSPSGGRVEIRADQRGPHARIEVRDRGSGVPHDFRGRIFSKFAMADGSDARTRGGTGLGLAIVREITERHGGAAGFDDRPGGGSVFHVDLPLVQDGVASTEDMVDGLPMLLHVDDDLDCLSVVASAFSGRASLLSVSSVAAAREVLATRSDIDACIVDVGMGHESGLDLLPTLRTGDPGLPIILFTAFDDPHSEAQADAVLVKSRTPIEALVETTMALVGRARRDAA